MNVNLCGSSVREKHVEQVWLELVPEIRRYIVDYELITNIASEVSKQDCGVPQDSCRDKKFGLSCIGSLWKLKAL